MNIDLCSGLGSWGDDTVRIDIDPKTRPDIIADVRHLPLRAGLKPKLVFEAFDWKRFNECVDYLNQFGYGFDSLDSRFGEAVVADGQVSHEWQNVVAVPL